jgi:hypothetical protein
LKNVINNLQILLIPLPGFKRAQSPQMVNDSSRMEGEESPWIVSIMLFFVVLAAKTDFD